MRGRAHRASEQRRHRGEDRGAASPAGPLCCVPGGRDPILATLEGDSFVLESMDPERRATAMSVAAHSLYEQSDPDRVAEPEGVLLRPVRAL